MKVLSVCRCVVISYVGRCCVWMEICLLILSSSILYTCEIGLCQLLRNRRYYYLQLILRATGCKTL
jgi:hypothetical protein